MLDHKVLETPWCKLASNIFHFRGANYLVLVDYTSRFPIGKQLKEIDQHSLLNIFEDICSKRGYPAVLASDNGPCFRGELFANFLKRKGIKHITSSSHYWQLNGLAEACVKVIKNLMHKTQRCGRSFNDTLYMSPVAGKKKSLIEILEHCRPRTNLPYINEYDSDGK